MFEQILFVQRKRTGLRDVITKVGVALARKDLGRYLQVSLTIGGEARAEELPSGLPGW